VNGSEYPLQVTIAVEITGGTAPWGTARMELVGNSFVFEPNVGKLAWFEGGAALTRVDLVNNVFYAPNVGAVLEDSLPAPAAGANPFGFLGSVNGNAFFTSPNETIMSGLSLAQWDQITLSSGSGASPDDVGFAGSALGLPVIGQPVAPPATNVIEAATLSRPTTSAAWAASGTNLFMSSGATPVDARGIDADLTGAAHPAAGKRGWTPGALQAK
jgi:hypothetical protein